MCFRMAPVLICLIASSAMAEVVVAVRTIRAQEVIGPEDLGLARGEAKGAYAAVNDLIGQEARVTLYAGRPVLRGDIGPPAVVERNEVVPMLYSVGGLVISSEGRALQRAAMGEAIRVMNLSSRQTVVGQVMPNGSVRISERGMK